EIKPVCVYSVTKPDNFDGEESFGMLFFADIQCFETELHNEIEKIAIMDEFSQKWLWENSFFRNVVSRLASLVYYPFLRKL
ncbi:MAG: hypothetical protein NC123_12980, partial [Butyrivibrio sp.]|nr:hypothetical protein [Butyrivibrio sp.]